MRVRGVESISKQGLLKEHEASPAAGPHCQHTAPSLASSSLGQSTMSKAYSDNIRYGPAD